MTHHLFLLRHGTTEWIEARRVQGSSDSPLTERGRDEARQALMSLAGITFDAVFCSPMGRTRETAAIVCAELGIEPVFLDDLREMDFGRYEGYAYIDPQQGELTAKMKINLFIKMVLAQITGESMRQVKQRAWRAWQSMLENCPHGTVLIIAHGVILNALLAHLMPVNEYRKIRTVQLKPCSLTEILVADTGHADLLRLDDCRHLGNSKVS